MGTGRQCDDRDPSAFVAHEATAAPSFRIPIQDLLVRHPDLVSPGSVFFGCKWATLTSRRVTCVLHAYADDTFADDTSAVDLHYMAK